MNYDPFKDLNQGTPGLHGLWNPERKTKQTMGKLFGGALVLNLLWVGFVIWLVGSTVTSAVKAGTDQCDTRLGAESVFSGGWFCPDKEGG